MGSFFGSFAIGKVLVCAGLELSKLNYSMANERVMSVLSPVCYGRI